MEARKVAFGKAAGWMVAENPIRFRSGGAGYHRYARRIELVERPPIVDVPEYLAARRAARGGQR